MHRCGSTITFSWEKGDRPEGVVDEGLILYKFA